MKKTLVTVIMLFIFIVSLAGCVGQNGSQSKETQNIKTIKIEYKNITPFEAKQKLDSGKGIILLDVRTLEEYREKHIPGSILIPVDVIDSEAQLKLKDKDAHIFVYCRSGRRSVTASESLVKQGYKNVFNLGGINDWPYETQAGEPK